MAIINFTQLNRIPAPQKPVGFTALELKRIDITQVSDTHHSGAYCLAAALTALGVLPRQCELNVHLDSDKAPFLVSAQVSLFPDFSFAKIARKLYRVTGVGNEVAIDELIEAGGVNSLAAMSSVALQLGLKAHLQFTQACYKHYLQFMPHELQRCKEVLGDAQLVVSDVERLPNNDEIALVLVHSLNDIKPHWLALSHDNSYYDPLRSYYPGQQFGVVGAPWSSRPYVDSGLTLWLSVNN